MAILAIDFSLSLVYNICVNASETFFFVFICIDYKLLISGGRIVMSIDARQIFVRSVQKILADKMTAAELDSVIDLIST